MRFGFPLGDLAPILATRAHPNYPAANQHMDFIREYVDEQVALGRMTGPYSRARAEAILGSPFISSPLSVVPKAEGKLRMVQNCSFGDEYGLSVNGRIDADLYPTRWGTAARVAELVSVNHTGWALGAEGSTEWRSPRQHGERWPRTESRARIAA